MKNYLFSGKRGWDIREKTSRGSFISYHVDRSALKRETSNVMTHRCRKLQHNTGMIQGQRLQFSIYLLKQLIESVEVQSEKGNNGPW